MAILNWKQPATLQLLSRRGTEPGQAHILDGPFISDGTLAEAIDAFSALRPKDRPFARLQIAFGFHLDGMEIAPLTNIPR